MVLPQISIRLTGGKIITKVLGLQERKPGTCRECLVTGSRLNLV
jgi:hypothetical protein